MFYQHSLQPQESNQHPGVDGRHLQETKMDARRRANQFIPLLTTIRGQWEGRSYVLFLQIAFR